MSISLHQEQVVVLSHIMYAQLSNIHLLAHILGTCAMISVFVALHLIYGLPKLHHVTASHLSPGDKPPKHRRVV